MIFSVSVLVCVCLWIYVYIIWPIAATNLIQGIFISLLGCNSLLPGVLLCNIQHKSKLFFGSIFLSRQRQVLIWSLHGPHTVGTTPTFSSLSILPFTQFCSRNTGSLLVPKHFSRVFALWDFVMTVPSDWKTLPLDSHTSHVSLPSGLCSNVSFSVRPTWLPHFNCNSTTRNS